MSTVNSIVLAVVFSVFPVANTDVSPQQSVPDVQVNQTSETETADVAAHNVLQNCVDTPSSQLKWISTIA